MVSIQRQLILESRWAGCRLLVAIVTGVNIEKYLKRHFLSRIYAVFILNPNYVLRRELVLGTETGHVLL
jgi:hypothetical protein